MTERDLTRARVRATAADLRADPFHYFPEWYRRTRPTDLARRPIFLAGTWVGWGDAIARMPGGLDIRGGTEWIPGFLVSGVLWRAAPMLRRLPGFDADRLGAVERTLLELGSVRGGLLSTEQWVRRAKATPGSLSLIPEEGEQAREYARIARTNGIDALYLTEALRTPGFEMMNRGLCNDMIGDIPQRIEDYLALEDLLVDEESVQVLHRTLIYRMTHHQVELEPIVQGGCRKYFSVELVAPTGDERFVDIGAFTGDTIRQFLNVTDGRFRQVIALEPDDHNFLFLKKFHATLGPDEARRVICLNEGAWDEQTRLTFRATATAGSTIELGGEVSIEVTTIDALADEYGAPTLVKCEAEGADRQALAGGMRTMREHRPRMAVTVYHLADDYLAMIPMLRAANPDYRLALRHYTLDHSGTTVYAY